MLALGVNHLERDGPKGWWVSKVNPPKADGSKMGWAPRVNHSKGDEPLGLVGVDNQKGNRPKR